MEEMDLMRTKKILSNEKKERFFIDFFIVKFFLLPVFPLPSFSVA
jgi:hypothetical protein